MFKSWKTAITGIVTVGSGIFLIVKGNTEVGISLVVAGVGLFFAKDSDVTGVGKDAKSEKNIDDAKQ